MWEKGGSNRESLKREVGLDLTAGDKKIREEKRIEKKAL